MFKKLFSIVFILVLAQNVFAQGLELYRPVGFQNPMLKSGQYIFSTLFNSNNFESEQVQGTLGTKNIFESSRYNFSTVGYFGITDKITLSTTLAFFPKQTFRQQSGGIRGRDQENFHIQTDISLSYRLRDNFELWGSFFYTNTTASFGDRIHLREIPVFDPETGQIIIIQDEAILEAMPDIESTTKNFRIGFTLVGSVW